MSFNVHRIVGGLKEYIGRGKTRRQFTHDHPSRSKFADRDASFREGADAYFDHLGELVAEDEETGERWCARIVWAPMIGEPHVRTNDRGRA